MNVFTTSVKYKLFLNKSSAQLQKVLKIGFISMANIKGYVETIAKNEGLPS